MKRMGRKTLLLGVCLVILGLMSTPYSSYSSASSYKHDENQEMLTFSQVFSPPEVVEDEQGYLSIGVSEANTALVFPGEPKLPVFSKTIELPIGSKIKSVNVVTSSCENLVVSKTVEPVPLPQSYGMSGMPKDGFNIEIYENNRFYPPTLFSYHTGAGMDSEGNHVLYLSLQIYPVRYNPVRNVLRYTQRVDVSISYQAPSSLSTLNKKTSVCDFVIISPAVFSDLLQPLVEHKEKYGLKTRLVTLDGIYASFNGRDKAEKVKYFIKYALDEWGVRYVLLVGDIKRLPIRATYAFPWEGWGNNILSDLYYADIYDANFSFCSWDGNNNNRFGEVIYNYTGFPPRVVDVDGVDLYPDVYVGRLACKNRDDVEIVVDKIINYEEKTFDQIWFKRIVLAGGDTFPPAKGAPPFVYEGEITNVKVMQQLPDFEHIVLWSSKHNLNAFTFNRAINKGAGFVSYAGHGFEQGWATYKPNALRNKMGIRQPFYLTPFVEGLRNQYKLPVIFFDACLTAKLDYNITDVERYFPTMVKILRMLPAFVYDPSIYITCFAWSFLIHRGGGAVAVIGATRPAYTLVDRDGVYAGAGYLDVHFFKAYNEGTTVSQMFNQAQVDYINYVGRDFFTLEEFILLGDPSLRVGGYP
ncbi:MAG: hypothetical protein J7L32_02755 [Thermoplasmata archaeon]|nr:hypothetical protein [Thermoplasmata archaeon]